jgi:microcystin-dependent protein
MAIKSYPYSSVDGDRKITASDEAKRLDLIAGSGIIFDDATSFECSKVAGTMNVNVSAGSALVAGHGIISDATETVEISASDSTYSRIDVIALESNTNTDIRAGRVVVIKGIASATPVEPALSTEAGVAQIKLAKILIPASISSLSTATLTDMRMASVGKHKHSKAQITGVSSWNGIIGEIKAFAGSAAPTGTLLCDGSAVSRTTYSALFAVIGTNYGAGNGSTTFNLPNMKGKVPVGYNSAETEFNVLGKTGGEKTHINTIAEMPNHTHEISTTVHSEEGTHDWEFVVGTGAGTRALTLFKSITAAYTGGGGSHNNLQPYVAVNYIIVYA